MSNQDDITMLVLGQYGIAEGCFSVSMDMANCQSGTLPEGGS
jgi:hypothetical protein